VYYISFNSQRTTFKVTLERYPVVYDAFQLLPAELAVWAEEHNRRLSSGSCFRKLELMSVYGDKGHFGKIPYVSHLCVMFFQRKEE